MCHTRLIPTDSQDAADGGDGRELHGVDILMDVVLVCVALCLSWVLWVGLLS